MNKFILSSYICVLVLLGASFVYAEEQASMKNIAIETNSAVQAQELVKKTVQRPEVELVSDINNYINTNKLKTNGRQIFYGIVRINKEISHPDYARYRVLAYEEAYLQALSKFFRSVAITYKSETLQKVFVDNSSNREDFDKELASEQSSFVSLIDKIMALTGAKLDAALKELGIDPVQFNASPADQKKVLLSNQMVTKSVQRFSKSLGGITTIQTFFRNNEEGFGAVGVIIVYSPKIESVADAFKMGKKPAMLQLGKPLKELLPLDNNEKLYNMLGSRLLIDDNGPVLVAFGQWANSSVSEDDTLLAEYRDAAFEQARDIAYKEISTFLNQSFTSEIETERGKILEEYVVKEGKTGMIEKAKEEALIDKMYKQAQARTSSYLQGAQILQEWIYGTPEGHEVVGVIMTYSFDNIQNAKSVFDEKTDFNGKENKKQYDSSYSEGAVSMDLNAF